MIFPSAFSGSKCLLDSCFSLRLPPGELSLSDDLRRKAEKRQEIWNRSSSLVATGWMVLINGGQSWNHLDRKPAPPGFHDFLLSSTGRLRSEEPRASNDQQASHIWQRNVVGVIDIHKPLVQIFTSNRNLQPIPQSIKSLHLCLGGCPGNAATDRRARWACRGAS